ncbi:uncharacterized protein HMPREF1541_08031 [Cyphellophora europaea CBS 101466]|uniref:Uncharacterized protein n=1 Tax=Cyphellophora europaea (strain CBS 101466) TaxID=1220924 RepID=W2RKM6_CYPE1|nr:uncharacterized protein HMPREF1541_08031 [Cyphellophora europaea CBS 101466]ETN37042.1 hypothetical protein HMPREF1541_08031 [Cyphellophora europaea CBS 101466]
MSSIRLDNSNFRVLNDGKPGTAVDLTVWKTTNNASQKAVGAAANAGIAVMPPTERICSNDGGGYKWWPQCYTYFYWPEQLKYKGPFFGQVRQTRFPNGEGGYVQCQASGCGGPHPTDLHDVAPHLLDMLIPIYDDPADHPDGIECEMCKHDAKKHSTDHHRKAAWTMLPECFRLLPSKYHNFVRVFEKQMIEYVFPIPIQLLDPSFPKEHVPSFQEDRNYWETFLQLTEHLTIGKAYKAGLFKIPKNGCYMDWGAIAGDVRELTARIEELEEEGEKFDPLLRHGGGPQDP